MVIKVRPNYVKTRSEIHDTIDVVYMYIICIINKSSNYACFKDIYTLP